VNAASFGVGKEKMAALIKRGLINARVGGRA